MGVYTTIDKPEDYFKTVLYTGTHSSVPTVTVGFKSDFLWLKSRTQTYDHNLLDTSRGGTKKLASNNSNSESTTGDSVTFNATIKENERAMRKDMRQQAEEMLERSGFTDISSWEDKYVFGNGIHEMGTARMGHDPKTSVLNKFNQVHSVKNVYVTDGACMTSSGCQNPSITYMALTARAANHAVDELNKQNI